VQRDCTDFEATVRLRLADRVIENRLRKRQIAALDRDFRFRDACP
jgi:hypothetical protein